VREAKGDRGRAGGHGTRFHPDNGRAENVVEGISARDGAPAPACGPAAPRPVVAYWFCVKPSAIDLVTQIIDRLYPELKGEGFRAARIFTLEQLWQIAREAGAGMVVIEQRSGDKVSVPPYWIHNVHTVRSCVKLAWDRFLPSEAGIMAALWKNVKCFLYRDRDRYAIEPAPAPGAPDYLAMLRCLELAVQMIE